MRPCFQDMDRTMKNTLYIVWSKANELGIPIIDEQHRGIVSTINSLFFFMQGRRGLEVLRPTIAILEQYTRIHFDTEEALMKEAKYPNFDSHVLLHRQLAENTAAMSRVSIREDNADNLLILLKKWWINHINQQDREYSIYLREHLGLKR